jgi:hypothetical protein
MPEVPAGLIPLMLAILLIPPLVYLDATSHRIGTHPACRDGIPAGAWALLTLIPIVGPTMIAFVYLLMRGELIGRAALHPAIVPGGRRLAMYFLVFAAGVAATPYWLPGDVREPSSRKIPWYLDPARIDDDTPRPTGDDR